MLSDTIEKALNEQIKIEASSSQVYLAMASWAEIQGFEGVSSFMYAHSDEERMHMLKLVKFVNERGGHARVSTLEAPPAKFGSFKEMFQTLFDHEVMVSSKINELVDITLKEKDYATHNFLQWYVADQSRCRQTSQHTDQDSAHRASHGCRVPSFVHQQADCQRV